MHFPVNNGSYLITGNNLECAAMGSNALGKSSLLASLVWVLFEKTPEGAKAGALLRRGAAKGYSVDLEYEKNGSKHVLTRSWSPNKLLLDGIGVTNKEVEEIIGLTYDQFMATVLFSQENKGSFIDLGASAQLNFLAELFDLEKWTAYSDLCKTKIADLEKDLLTANIKDTHYKESHATNLESMGQLLNLEKSYKKEQRKKGEALITKIEALYDQFQSVPEAPEVAEKIAKLETKINALKLDKKQATTQMVACDVARHRHNSDVAELLKKINKIQKSEDCPTCEQTIPAKHANRCVDDWESMARDARQREALALTEANRLEREIESLDDTLAQLTAKKANRERAISNIENLTKSNAAIQSQIDYFSEEVEAIESGSNPYTAQLKELQKALVARGIEETQCEKTILECEGKIANYQFWLKRFPQVRLSILNEVLTELEIHFNQAFAQIGLLDWSIDISTERLLKNDSVKNEFTIKLLKGGEEISLSSLSGGERQRIRLCTNIGISEMIKARCGVVTCDLLLFDEPCASLSQEGIDNILALFSTLGESQRVLLAEHRVLNSEKFKDIFYLEKGIDGTTRLVNENR
jgi:DNA repair exonuclease SbcCD ATPase subunit